MKSVKRSPRVAFLELNISKRTTRRMQLGNLKQTQCINYDCYQLRNRSVTICKYRDSRLDVYRVKCLFAVESTGFKIYPSLKLLNRFQYKVAFCAK